MQYTSLAPIISPVDTIIVTLGAAAMTTVFFAIVGTIARVLARWWEGD